MARRQLTETVSRQAVHFEQLLLHVEREIVDDE